MAIPVDEKVIERYILSFKRNGSPKTRERLEWMHLGNPLRESVIALEEDRSHDHYAALYTAMPVIMQSGEDSLRCLQSVDTLTDRDYRGKGLFIKLASQLYDEASRQGYSYVYGFPNESSGPGFFNKLGWTSYGLVPHKMRLCNVLFPLNHLFKMRLRLQLPVGKHHTGVTPVAHLTDEHRVFLDKVSAQFAFGVRRNLEYLNWRVFNNPNHQYMVFELRNQHGICSLGIINIKYEKHGANIGYIMDLLFAPGAEKEGTMMLQHCVYELRRQRADLIFAWNKKADFNAAVYQRNGFRLIPERFRKIRLFFGIKSLRQDVDVPSPDTFYISYLDSDTV